KITPFIFFNYINSISYKHTKSLHSYYKCNIIQAYKITPFIFFNYINSISYKHTKSLHSYCWIIQMNILQAYKFTQSIFYKHRKYSTNHAKSFNEYFTSIQIHSINIP